MEAIANSNACSVIIKSSRTMNGKPAFFETTHGLLTDDLNLANSLAGTNLIPVNKVYIPELAKL
jgi:hypothetical protein